MWTVHRILFSIVNNYEQKYNITAEYKTLTAFCLLAFYVTYKTLISSDECERDNPDLALFKYDKRKPQRLSFLGDVDVNTGNREEWCIHHWYANTIQVAPMCVFYPDNRHIE